MRYFLSPGFGQAMVPVIQSLRWIIPVVALILVDAGLIPRSHAAAQRAAAGQGSIGEVLAVAASNLKWRLDALPQIVMFASVVGLLTFGIGLVVILGFGAGTAAAQMTGSWFSADDIGSVWIRNIFGVSGASSLSGTTALAPMLTTYSLGCTALAMLVLVWQGMHKVFDTMATGSLLGRGTKQISAPVRLLMAFGLLIPIQGGYSAGQLVVIRAAEAGSALGTNIWAAFATNVLSGEMPLVSPNPPNLAKLATDILMQEVCRQGLNQERAQYIIARGGDPSVPFVNIVNESVTRDPGLWDMITSFSNDPVVVGVREVYQESDTQDDICGWVQFDNATFETGEDIFDDWMTSGTAPSTNSGVAGAQAIMNAHVATVHNARGRMAPEAARILSYMLPWGANYHAGGSPNVNIGTMVTDFSRDLAQVVGTQILAMQGETVDQIGNEVIAQGWIAAPTYFHRIARINASLMDATNMVAKSEGPKARRVSEHNQEVGAAVGWLQSRIDVFLAQSGGGAPQTGEIHDLGNLSDSDLDDLEPGEGVSGRTEYDRDRDRVDLGPNEFLSRITPSRTIMFNFDSNNPLAEMAALGHSLILAAMPFFVVGLVADVLPEILEIGVDIDASAFAGFLYMIGSMMLMAGLTLSYVLPLFPAVRFIFGILTWLIAVFEAVIAVPILALAHMKDDGQGLIGPLAQKGYFAVLQVFLRPTLMSFALVISLLCFNTIIGIFNQIFVPVLIEATGGLDLLEMVFASVFYIMCCYTLANASFKIIDMLPNEVMRWLGGDAMGDLDATNTTTSFMQRAIQTGVAYRAGSGLLGSAQGAARDVGRGAGSITERLNRERRDRRYREEQEELMRKEGYNQAAYSENDYRQTVIEELRRMREDRMRNDGDDGPGLPGGPPGSRSGGPPGGDGGGGPPTRTA